MAVLFDIIYLTTISQISHKLSHKLKITKFVMNYRTNIVKMFVTFIVTNEMWLRCFFENRRLSHDDVDFSIKSN